MSYKLEQTAPDWSEQYGPGFMLVRPPLVVQVTPLRTFSPTIFILNKHGKKPREQSGSQPEETVDRACHLSQQLSLLL